MSRGRTPRSSRSFVVVMAALASGACSASNTERGPAGEAGPPGPPGRDGERVDASADGVVLRWDCAWCPGDAGLEEDDGITSCWDDFACPEGQRCTGEPGSCAPSPEWAAATATLHTAFDGLTHTFQLLGAALTVICSERAGDYWDMEAPASCSLSLVASHWSASDRGASYGGRPIDVGEYYVEGLTTTGPQALSCSYGVLNGTRFTSEPVSCALTVEELALHPGGFIRGTFARTDRVTGPGETENASSFELTGTFRAVIPQP